MVPGFETTLNAICRPRVFNSSRTICLTRSAVPTGTVDVSMITVYRHVTPNVACGCLTCCISTEPFSSGGFPTAINCKVLCKTASFSFAVKTNRLAAILRRTISKRLGLYIGRLPSFKVFISPVSRSKQTTWFPRSARHAVLPS